MVSSQSCHNRHNCSLWSTTTSPFSKFMLNSQLPNHQPCPYQDISNVKIIIMLSAPVKIKYQNFIMLFSFLMTSSKRNKERKEVSLINGLSQICKYSSTVFGGKEEDTRKNLQLGTEFFFFLSESVLTNYLLLPLLPPSPLQLKFSQVTIGNPKTSEERNNSCISRSMEQIQLPGVTVQFGLARSMRKTRSCLGWHQLSRQET